MFGNGFETDRLIVRPWRRALEPDALVEFVVALLTPAVTADLPPDWQNVDDADRAAAWANARDAESTPLLVSERGGTEVGLLVLTSTHPGEVRLGYLFSEQAWGRGLATELVSGVTTWCRSAVDIRTVVGGVATGNEASAAVLRKNGFQAVGAGRGSDAEFRLVIDRPETIRPEAATDHAAIRRVVTDAFGSAVEADLVERIRASPEYVPEMALVAVVDGELVGHVMISGALVRNDTGDHSIVMLSPLAVLPDRQRQGIGAALIGAVCSIADQRGEPLVVLEGNPAFYRRFGFEDSVDHGLTLPLPDWAPSGAGQVKLLSRHDPNDPRLRGDVVYPAAFDGLA